MSDFVIMPKADYQDVCDLIRSHTGGTEPILSGDLKAQIESVIGSGAGGGSGSSEDVRYVTFMSYDGTVEYGKKAVAVGDDCADPITRGVFDTPTRESDVQYNYVHAGWATEVNGGLDSNALKAVNEDRTVYANFAAVVRYYTITFYDSDGTTVLATKSVAYGSTPSYEPTKDGYDFDKWDPSVVSVTGDASYTATWKAKAAFATATWAEISAITNAGTSASTFAVGDKRSEVLTYSDGTTEEIELIIAKIRDDGTMVLALNHALETLQPIGTSSSGAAANYFNDDIGKYLTNTVVPAFSPEFDAVIRTANVMFADRKVRLLTRNNCGTSTSTTVEYESIPLFTTAQDRIRKRNGNVTTYWLGSCNNSGTSGVYFFDYIDTSGNIVGSSGMGLANGVTTARGIVFLVDV